MANAGLDRATGGCGLKKAGDAASAVVLVRRPWYPRPVDTLLATLEEENAILRRQLARRDAELQVANAQIEALIFNLAVLRRRQFGHSSEKLDAAIEQLELRLEDLEESQAEQSAKQPQPAGPAPARPRKPALRKPLPAHLPRETVVHEPEIICVCQACDRSKLTCLGEDVTEVLEKIPARLKVIRHVRPRYACRTCEGVFQAPAPDLPIERGRPGPGLIANVAVSKFCDGLPLYRQSVILAREGIDIDRATLADWLGRAAWWLAPLAVLIGHYVMGLPVIHTDDTTIKVLAPGLGKTRMARFWVYAADPRIWAGVGPPVAFYRYSPDRDGERPRSHLAGFSGFLHADAYGGYDALYRAAGQQPPRVTGGSGGSTVSGGSTALPATDSARWYDQGKSTASQGSGLQVTWSTVSIASVGSSNTDVGAAAGRGLVQVTSPTGPYYVTATLQLVSPTTMPASPFTVGIAVVSIDASEGHRRSRSASWDAGGTPPTRMLPESAAASSRRASRASSI